METFRCICCNKKLGEGEFTRLSIKCPRCGHVNDLKATSLPTVRGHHGETYLPLDRRQAPTRKDDPAAVS
ncbi:MAG: Com family DNA-binding transcriptional regulator [Proteobacteria bacterium]|nr:Com family DNA-binding transcriptional regulator [Pseudomonadota bacterium]